MEDVIADGVPLGKRVVVSDPSMQAAGLERPDGEAVILVSNYYRVKDTRAEVRYTPKHRCEVIDLDTMSPVAAVTPERPHFPVTAGLSPRTKLYHLRPTRENR